ncbi:hypothetical protein QUA26_15795 [Microcoleus sp. Pol12A4]
MTANYPSVSPTLEYRSQTLFHLLGMTNISKFPNIFELLFDS